MLYCRHACDCKHAEGIDILMAEDIPLTLQLLARQVTSLQQVSLNNFLVLYIVTEYHLILGNVHSNMHGSWFGFLIYVKCLFFLSTFDN